MRFLLYIVVLSTTLTVSCSDKGSSIKQAVTRDSVSIAGVDQAATDTGNVLEQLISRKGSLLVIDKREVGEERFHATDHESGGYETRWENLIHIDALVAYTLEPDSAKVRGLLIGVGQDAMMYGANPKARAREVAFVSYPEALGLVRAIDGISRLSRDWKGTKRENTKAIFQTADGFKLYFKQVDTLQTTHFQIGEESTARGEKSCRINSPEELAAAKTLIERGIGVARSL